MERQKRKNEEFTISSASSSSISTLLSDEFFCSMIQQTGQRCSKHDMTLPNLTRPCILRHTPLQSFSNSFDELPKVLLIGVKQGRWWGIHDGCLVRQGTEWLKMKNRIMGTATTTRKALSSTSSTQWPPMRKSENVHIRWRLSENPCS